MRTDAHKRMHFAALAACLLTATLFAAACGDEVDSLPDDMDSGTDTDTDADTDTDTEPDAGEPYVCTQEEVDAQNAAIQAALAEAAPCYTGGIVPMVGVVNAYFLVSFESEPSLVLCTDSTPNEIASNGYEAAAVAALEGMELLCLGNSTEVSGGTAVDVAALREAIDAVTEPTGADAGTDAGTDAGADAVCAVEGLDDPLYVVDIAADGGVSDVVPAEADTSPETAAYANCLDTALAELSLPCLATMQICSDYP